MNRAIVVLGMHRSGTSALTRGLKALSVYLGENFFDLTHDNPTGYWEDKTIVALNQRLLEEMKLKWDDTPLIDYDRFKHHRIRVLEYKAGYYLKETFGAQPLWGFKDPRTIRFLPFWREALRGSGAEDCYVVAIRHPRSVAASLFRRQQIPLEKAQRLWLVHNVPFLHELRDKPFVVVDYDLLAREPHEQLERIAHAFSVALNADVSAEIDRFASDFLDASLRHNVFSAEEFDTDSDVGRLARDAYLSLYGLAIDSCSADTAFWATWKEIGARLEALSPVAV
jgi:O-antigen biosynthesis protein